MPDRIEPRFQVHSAVSIAPVERPDLVSQALVLDVSGSGMKIIAERDWPQDSCVVVEMENHLVLARVRNSQPHGTRFSVGVERIHSVLKLLLPLDAPRSEWHKILLAEAGQAPAEQVVAEGAAPGSFQNSSDSSVREPRIPDRQVQPALDHQTQEGPSTAQEPFELAPPLEAAQAPQPEPAHVTEPARVAEIVPASEEKNDPPPAPAFSSTIPAAVHAKGGPLSSAVTPDFGVAFGMAPTGGVLTPVSTITEAPEIQTVHPRWIISAAVAAGLIGLVALAFYVGPFRRSASRTPAPAAAAPAVAPLEKPTGVEKRAARAAKGAAPGASQSIAKATPAPPPAPAASAPPAGARRATVKASAMNWVSACSDGKPAFAKLLAAGDIREIDFERTAVIRVGNAGAAEITVDGQSIGALGAPGALKIVEIGAAGVRNLPLNLPPEAECQSAQVPTAAPQAPLATKP